jgi:phosphodiesterase/alkaline phosphatase D-like protein
VNRIERRNFIQGVGLAAGAAAAATLVESPALAQTAFAKAPNFVVNGLKREELIATNSMILHEVYFDSLGGGGAPGGALAQAVAPDFGSVDRWRTEFTARPQTRRELNGEQVFGDNRSAVTGTLVATSLM